MKRVTLALLALASTLQAAPRALVYNGPGACPEGCANAAAESAQAAGFDTRFIGPDEVAPQAFAGVSLWVQPGGHSSEASIAIKPRLKENLRAFLAAGGAYVGYCAGGFIATVEISDRHVPGFGILPGLNTPYYPPGFAPPPGSAPGPDTATIIPVSWRGTVRQMYWEGGPSFIAPPAPVQDAWGYEVTATYVNGTIASARSYYGKGRVYVTGLHPEAPQYWRDYYHLTDTDGRDMDLAVEMIRWATGSER